MPSVFRILQIFFAVIYLAACTSTQSGPKASDHGNNNPAARGAQTASKTGAYQKNKASKAPAVSTPGDFVDDAGVLISPVARFARETAENENIPLDHVQALLLQARYDAKAARLMTPQTPHGRIRRAWHSYRKRHVDPVRIRSGVEFWQAHHRALQQASQRFGVPPQIIVAIIGIETVYGRFTGDHRTLDTLSTLAFRYPDPERPEREALFRRQLADLIALHEEGKLDAHTVRGSYAGAIGLPQFMPGSLRRYAVDGNDDGQIDLRNNTTDAIFSVAAFLKAHGWVRGLPVFAPVRLSSEARTLVQDGLTPTTDWTALQARGAQNLGARQAPWTEHPLGIIDLRDEIRDTHDYRTATPNFFAITQYNRSYFYAASVAELAEEIRARMT